MKSKMTKKKAAILLTGMVREWNLTSQQIINNLVEPNKEIYDIDIYAVTYSQTDRYITHRKKKENIDIEELKLLYDFYNFKKIMILNHREMYNKFLESKIHDKIEDYTGIKYKIDTIILQSYLIQEAYKLICEIEYDLILRTRFDILPEEKIKFNDFLHNGSLYTLPFNGDQNFTDHLIVGNKAVMKKYCNTFDKLKDNEFLKNNSICFVEDLFRQSLIFDNVNIKKINWKCSLLREKDGPHKGKMKLW
jgi:hypothetical protein